MRIIIYNHWYFITLILNTYSVVPRVLVLVLQTKGSIFGSGGLAILRRFLDTRGY